MTRAYRLLVCVACLEAGCDAGSTAAPDATDASTEAPQVQPDAGGDETAGDAQAGDGGAPDAAADDADAGPTSDGATDAQDATSLADATPDDADAAGDAADATTPADAAPDAADATTPADAAPDAADATMPADAADSGSGGWHLTTYFTAVDSFFSGASVATVGCLNVDCTASGDPNNALGSYASDFVATVQAEGTGAITSGPRAGQFLNWSASQPGTGFWLDTAPRDAQGNALVAYLSAAAHPSYAFGQSFRVLDCGLDQTASTPMDPQACADFEAATWQIRDRFESDSEVRHLDLYIGLQDQADMNGDPHFVDQVGASTTLP